MFTRSLTQVQLLNCVREQFKQLANQFSYSNIRQLLQCLEVS